MRLALKIPPVVQLLAAGVLIYASRYLWQLPSNMLVFCIGLGLVAVGIFIAFMGVLTFRQHQTTVDPRTPNKASQLVDSGVYQYTRNPMYLGMLCVLIGWSAILFSPLGLLVCIGFVFAMNQLQIKPEEGILGELFGEPYQQYCQNVRRWV